jgi:hypothetical protein
VRGTDGANHALVATSFEHRRVMAPVHEVARP